MGSSPAFKLSSFQANGRSPGRAKVITHVMLQYYLIKLYNFSYLLVYAFN